MMNLPNAAYTNAAHKNGALSLGCIFLPRAYQSWRTLIQRDEDGGFLTQKNSLKSRVLRLRRLVCQSGRRGCSLRQGKTELQAFLKTLRDAGHIYSVVRCRRKHQ